MIKNYYTMAFVMSAIFAGSGYASEVYIEQAGDSSTFNITQQNGTNLVGSSSTPASFSGNNIQVDIIQNGTLNSAAINVTSGTDTTINYNAQGDSNTLEIDIANSGNTLTVTKTGDSNRVTMCGTNTAGVAANNAVGCSTAVGASDTTNTVAITGDNNSVNLALMNNNAQNTVTIGNNAPSSGNAVNITQGAGLVSHTTGVTINGDTNTVNINQQ